ncbi:MAG: cation transporter [Defluviitaleaceae bacterium]|nr:cation transporter [Defluviitaleaceae bacterium]
MEKLALNVKGMTCSHCETAVKNAMEDLNVNVIQVSSEKELLEIEFDPSKVTLEQIKNEITDMDYTVA